MGAFAWRARASVLLLGGAVAVHQLVYGLAGVRPDEHAHAYLDWLKPVLFALLVGTVTGVLGAVVALISNVLTGGVGADDLRAAVVEGLLFAVLSPVGVAVAAAVYLLSIRTFVGKVADFPQVYRIAAYAFSAFVFAWVPVLGSVAISYALLVLMGIAIKEVYEASFLTAVITALVGFIPVGSALVWITAVALTS